MAEFNGWEKLEPAIGKGGQSTVYLARRPERAEQRKRILGSLQALSDAANQQSYAEAIYSFTRPDLPSEIGALKVFNFREYSGPPVARLKREIEILEKGLRNLPRLLDWNTNELWMVTEYFAKGTLAHYPGKSKGKALEALTAFRGLVETIAALHTEGVVHRDIKSENVFLADDGRLIPGDFGLVYYPDNTNRLTLPNETVGPWQHLPWWANTGTRLDSPTPAVDVFLLGSLLWCMVSGDKRLYGERYRHDTYNLEKRFPGDGRMGLVNLVLSQCLGDDEGKCVKDAGEVLTVVDEVIAAIRERAPVFDENNVLVLPCRVCGRGFLHQIVGPNGQGMQTAVSLHQDRVPLNTFHVDVFQCDVCTNTLHFLPNQPYQSLWGERKSRVDPQPSKTSGLRW